MTVSVRVDGVRDVGRQLQRVGIKSRTEIATAAARAGADIFRKEMLARAPVGPTGNLRKGIRTRKIKNGLAWQAVSRAPHAYLVEFGNTRTRPRRQKKLGTPPQHGSRPGKSTGNMPPNRFTTAAFEAKKRLVQRTVSRIIATEIDREAGR